MKTVKSRSGFTLVELLVVIAIVIILVSLIMTGIVALRQSGLRTACASNLRQMGVAMQAYAADNNGEIPAMYGPDRQHGLPIAWFNVGMDKDGNGNGGMWLLVKEPDGLSKQAYLPDHSLFFCPADSIGPSRTPVQSMTYIYCYVPGGGASFLPMGYHPASPPKPSDNAYHMVPGVLAGFERHSLKQGNAATTAIMVEGTVLHRIGLPWFKLHGRGGNILCLDGHVTSATIEMSQQQWEDPQYCIAAADRVVGG